MFILGHLGFGTRLAQGQIKHLPRKAFWLGCLLPDLIDKASYYTLSWSTGLQGAALPLIHGTRSLGHTLIFLALCWGLSRYKHPFFFKALTWGVVTHFVLDLITDQCTGLPHITGISHIPLLWPLSGAFPTSPHPSLSHHLLSIGHPFFIVTEILGAIALLKG